MRITFNIAAFRRDHWYEYAARFAAGGTVTVHAGLIAKRYGPGIGGLFLAFPAIFPAAATLLASHEEKLRRSDGRSRARKLAAADAFGAFLGAFGLTAFAVVFMFLIANHSGVLAISVATLAWATTAFVLWVVREYPWRARRARVRRSRERRHEGMNWISPLTGGNYE